MLRSTFADDIHSALKSVRACARAIKLCDNAVDHHKINQAIKKIKQCARLVRNCDSYLKDHRGLRASKPGRATSWEIRTTLGLPENANINNYSGKVNPDGSVDVWDDKYYGRRGGKLIGHAEASALDAAYSNKANIGTFVAGYSPGGPLGALNVAKNSINQVANKNIGAFYHRGNIPDPTEDKSALIRVMGQVGKAALLAGQIAAIVAAINFTGAGDSLAKGKEQIVRFKNWAGDVIKNIKNKITGRH